MAARPIDSLASFLPRLIVERLKSHPESPGDLAWETMDVAALLADVTDFTRLTSRLFGDDRLEGVDIGEILSVRFSAVINQITLHGGDVVKFAGDALLAVWPRPQGSDLSQAVTLAAQCALAIQALPPRLGLDAPLRLRVGVAAGPLLLMHVGGVDDQWEYVVAGRPLEDLASAQHAAPPGGVVVAGAALELLRDHAAFREPGSGELTAVPNPVPLPPVDSPRLPDSLEPALRRYVSAFVQKRLELDQGGWISEERPISVVFVNLPDLDFAIGAARATLQRSIQLLQHLANRYAGTIDKVGVDDKGAFVVIVFGLPTQAHGDDPERAAGFALEADLGLNSLHLEHGIGVASGQAFSGVYGGEGRFEYTVLGHAVNLAARLMAAANGGVLCDEPTVHGARGRIAFAPPLSLKVKGAREPVRACRPRWKTDMFDRQMRSLAELPRDRMVDRTNEVTELGDRLERLVLEKASSCSLILGEAGMGKSVLLERLLELAREQEVVCLVGTGHAVERGTPYFAVRRVVEQLLGTTSIEDPEARRTQVLSQVVLLPGMVPWAPLLNTVIPLGLPETTLTSGLSGRSRMQSTSELLAALMAAATSERPHLLVVDDAQWIDSGSWRFLHAVVRAVPSLMVVLAARPAEIDPPADCTDMLTTSAPIQVGPLERDYVGELVRERMKASSLDRSVSEFILDQAGGRPLHVEELCSALRERGMVRIVDGCCEAAADPQELRSMPFPHTLQAIIVSRLDALSPEDLLTIKVASAIGSDFPLALLEVIDPVRGGNDLASRLDRLTAHGLLSPDPSALVPTWVFSHNLTWAAAYSMLVPAQRRSLHRVIAEWYESCADNSTNRWPCLAHHWKKAGEPSRAIECLEAAGEEALLRGADREAEYFFSQAIDLAGQLPADTGSRIPPRQRSRWQARLGESRVNLGKIAQARPCFLAAMDDLEVPLPRTRVGWVLRLLRELAAQAVHRQLPSLRLPVPPAQDCERMKACVAILPQEAERCYFDNDLLGWLTCSILAINLAERTREAPLAARAYAGLAWAVGFLRLHGVASVYLRHAHLGVPRDRSTAYTAEATNHMTHCRWEACFKSSDEGLALMVSIGDHYSHGVLLTSLGYTRWLTGDLTAARSAYDEVLRSARKRTNVQHESWAITLMVPVLLELDRVEEALRLIAEGQSGLSSWDPISKFLFHGVSSHARLMDGDLDQASQAAERALEQRRQSPSMLHFLLLPGFTGILETLLALAGTGADPALLERISEAGKGLHGFALGLRFARPWDLYYQGRIALLSGKVRQARTLFGKAIALAERDGLPFAALRARLAAEASITPQSS